MAVGQLAAGEISKDASVVVLLSSLNSWSFCNCGRKEGKLKAFLWVDNAFSRYAQLTLTRGALHGAPVAASDGAAMCG